MNVLAQSERERASKEEKHSNITILIDSVKLKPNEENENAIDFIIIMKYESKPKSEQCRAKNSTTYRVQKGKTEWKANEKNCVKIELYADSLIFSVSKAKSELEKWAKMLNYSNRDKLYLHYIYIPKIL